jgi:glycosyltransferase involved in cell wall biosynthesis
MRVLLVASEEPPVVSGVARAVGRLAAELGARGHEVDVVSSNDSRRIVAGEFRFSAMAATWPAIRSRLASYDIVNVHGPAPTISDAFLFLLSHVRRSERLPLVYTHHANLDIKPWGRASAIYNQINRRLAHRADQTVVTTPSYQALLAQPGKPRVEVIEWGVDAKAFDTTLAARFNGRRALRVLFVGQMRPYKGVPVLLDAVAGHRNLRASIVGSGPLEDRYRHLARATGDNVRFFGPVHDDAVRALLLGHDVLALPSTSRAEAFGLVLLEGMAAYCVPVASDLPGVRDIAGPTGRLVHPGSANSLRSTLLNLAADPMLVRRLQLESRRRAEGMTWERVGAAYERIFRRTIDQTGKTSICADLDLTEVVDLDCAGAGGPAARRRSLLSSIRRPSLPA